MNTIDYNQAEKKFQKITFASEYEIKNLKKLWVTLRLISATLNTSVSALQLNWRNKLKRDKVNQMLLEWARRLFARVQANCVTFNEKNFTFEENKPYIIMSNHISNFDIPAIFLGVKGTIRMLAKKELFSIPIWGKAMQKSEFLAIDRKNQRQAHRDLAVAREKMLSGVQLWISPEGGIAQPQQGLLPFKSGGFRIAMDTGATIVPIGIRGSNMVNTPVSRRLYKKQEVSLHIGDPIDTQANSTGMKNIMSSVREQLIKLGDYCH